MSGSSMQDIRNIAIIAHVDHGKTTLVDQLLRQSGTFRENQKVDERIMDSMDLEREKGITIRSKNASFRVGDTIVNVVDTPGHADFGGEVERIMKMVDGVLLVVDAYEGPQAQTKFVLRKALEQGAKAIVVINKIDRENARPHEVLDMVFELFLDLNASDQQLDFPIVYASAKDGISTTDLDQPGTDFQPLFKTILEQVPAPEPSGIDYPQFLVSNLDYSDYLGRIAYGRIVSGEIKVGMPMALLHPDGRKDKGSITAIFGHQGLQKVQIEEAREGDIVGISGFEEVWIGDTLTDSDKREPLAFVQIDPPTISMGIMVNDSPLAGREGKLLTARHIWDRLVKETRTNVSLQVSETGTAGQFDVKARGEMQIAVLVEQMRREGFELMVSRPEVIYQEGENGERLEPIETLYVDVPNENLGDILQSLAGRRADIINMKHQSSTVLVEANVPTRGLIGFESDLVNLTKGHGIMSHLFLEYAPYKGEITSRNAGALVSMEAGISTAYALNNVQDRGRLFIGAGTEIYAGMIVGENARADDLDVNPCKAKHLTNMRSSGDGKGIQLDPPLLMTLEKALEYIADDELVEATPTALRLRKKILDSTQRRRASKKAA